MTGSNHPLRHREKGAFTLCEVVIALAIFAFSLISILGLMPVALSSVRDSLDIATSTELANRVATDLRREPFDSLSDTQQPQSRRFYFDEAGQLISGEEGASYVAAAVMEVTDSDNLIRTKITLSRPGENGTMRSFCYLIFNND